MLCHVMKRLQVRGLGRESEWTFGSGGDGDDDDALSACGRIYTSAIVQTLVWW